MKIQLIKHINNKTLSALAVVLFASTSLAHGKKPDVSPLVVYAPSSYTSSYGPSKLLTKLFYKQYHAKIKWIGLDGSTTIITRLKLEGKKSKADAVVEMADPIIQTLNQNSYLKTIDPKTFPAIAIHKKAYDSKHYIPIETGQLAFVYNNKKIKNPPKSIADLANSKYKVILEDPRFSGTGISFLYWVDSIYKKKTTQILQQLMKHTITQKTWDDSYNMFLKGESDFVLSYATSPAYHILEEHNNNYSATMFTHGNLETNYYAGILKTSKHPQLATNFIKMLLSKEGQEIISRKNYALPVIKEKISIDKSLLKYKNTQLSVTPAYIRTNKKRLQRLWLNLK